MSQFSRKQTLESSIMYGGESPPVYSDAESVSPLYLLHISLLT